MNENKNEDSKKGIYTILETLGSLKDASRSLEKKRSLCQETVEEYREEIKALIEYIAISGDLSGVDMDFLIFLCELLGIDVTTLLENTLKKDKQEKEIEQTEKFKKRKEEGLKLLLVYAMYRLISPHKLAGQTLLEDFIKDIRQSGWAYALEAHGARLEVNKSIDLMNNVMHPDKTHNSKRAGFSSVKLAEKLSKELSLEGKTMNF